MDKKEELILELIDEGFSGPHNDLMYCTKRTKYDYEFEGWYLVADLKILNTYFVIEDPRKLPSEYQLGLARHHRSDIQLLLNSYTEEAIKEREEFREMMGLNDTDSDKCENKIEKKNGKSVMIPEYDKLPYRYADLFSDQEIGKNKNIDGIYNRAKELLLSHINKDQILSLDLTEKLFEKAFLILNENNYFEHRNRLAKVFRHYKYSVYNEIMEGYEEEVEREGWDERS